MSNKTQTAHGTQDIENLLAEMRGWKFLHRAQIYSGLGNYSSPYIVSPLFIYRLVVEKLRLGKNFSVHRWNSGGSTDKSSVNYDWTAKYGQRISIRTSLTSTKPNVVIYLVDHTPKGHDKLTPLSIDADGNIVGAPVEEEDDTRS